MKVKHTLLGGMIITLCLILSGGSSYVRAQSPGPAGANALMSSAITYQGRLQDAGGPVNGECDFRFKLFASTAGSDQVGSTLDRMGVSIQDGYFSVPDLDFGAGAFHGEARWLAVAVRCPAGVGTYESLVPRQALTAAPSALSLRLPFLAEANLGGTLAWFENDGVGEAAGFSSAQGTAMWVDHAGADGLHIASAGGNGLRVVSAGTQGLLIDGAGGDGVHVGSAAATGVYVGSTGYSGIHVDSTGYDGVVVHEAGNPSASAYSAQNNGFEVAGAQGSGLSVGRADLDGAYVSSAGYRGFAVGEAGTTGVYIGGAGKDGAYVHKAGNPSTTTPSELKNGFEVAGAEGNGLFVGRADGYGVYIASSFEDGVRVIQSGPAAGAVYNRESDGFDVGSAHGNGLFVGWADLDGVNVYSAGQNGISVGTTNRSGVAVDSAARHGFEVTDAQNHGLYVGRADDTGVYVQSAGWNGVVVDTAGGDGVRATMTTYNALFGDTANAQGEWGLYTPDKIHAQNVTMQSLTIIAQVSGPEDLYPGDVVTAAGVADPLPGSSVPLPLVQLAGNGMSGIVGVVESRFVFTSVPHPGGVDSGERLELRSAEGPANPGEYVALTILGVAQVKTDLAQENIQPGSRLTGADAGYARPLKTVSVDGITLAESAATIGIALSTPDEQGMVWVLVKPQ